MTGYQILAHNSPVIGAGLDLDEILWIAGTFILIGGTTGAILWKTHRILGFVLGSIASIPLMRVYDHLAYSPRNLPKRTS